MLRLRSLKTRTALALSSVIVAILVFNGVYMILTKRGELRKGIEEDARTFARLTRSPIASAFLSFYATDFYRFRELMRSLLAMNRDVTRPVLLRPPVRCLEVTSDFSGRSLVISSRRWFRPASASAMRRMGSFTPVDECTQVTATARVRGPTALTRFEMISSSVAAAGVA